jgi:tRNA A-37 threonylcarbamoyl transferase component Bud32
MPRSSSASDTWRRARAVAAAAPGTEGAAPVQRGVCSLSPVADPEETVASSRATPAESDTAIRAGEDPSHAPKGVLADPENLVGRTIAEKYRVTKVIAKGGMGRIYRAEHLLLGRPCALKILRASTDLVDSTFRQRFLREAETSAKLSHPNIVVVYDYGKIDGLSREAYFMAMELVEGPTLAELLREEGKLAPQRAIAIARDVARGLATAHRQGVVHRDLKPSNVMLATGLDGEHAKVLDFGIAKLVHEGQSQELTQEGLLLGSPKYMAPEQIQRQPINERTDIYSLGVMLYEMLAGHVPFEGRQASQTMMAHLIDPPPPLDGIAPELEAVVRRCLEKSPDARFQSARDLIRELSLLDPRAGEVDATGGASWSTGGRSWSPQMPLQAARARRTKGRAAAIVILIGALIGAIAGLSSLGSQGTGSEDTEQTVATPGPAVGEGGHTAPQQGGAGPGAPATADPAAVAVDPSRSEAPREGGATGAVVEPAAAAGFTLFVETRPPGAVLNRDGARIGLTPMPLELDRAEVARRPVTFRLEMPGFAPYVWTQGPSVDDVRAEIDLQPLPGRRRPGRRGGAAVDPSAGGATPPQEEPTRSGGGTDIRLSR